MMKRMYGLALALVLVGAGCAPASAPSKQTNQPVPVPGQAEVVTPDEASLFADGLYQLDTAKSSMQWQASKVKLGHNGTIAPREGFVRLVNNQPTEGSLLVDMTTLKNADQEGKMKEMIENHLRSADFFDVAQYPTASFAVGSMTPVTGIEGSNYRLDGKLTIKNVTNDVSFPVHIERITGGLRLTGRATVDRTAYGVKYGSGKFFENLGDNLIEDDFRLDLDLTFNTSPQDGGTTEGAIELNTDISGS